MSGPSKNLSNIMPWNGFCIVFHNLSMQTGLYLTGLPDAIVAFSQDFIAAKQIQWNVFRKKLEQEHVPSEFADIVMNVKEFIKPVALALASKKPPPSKWSSPGPWV